MAARKGNGKNRGRQAIRHNSSRFSAWRWILVGLLLGALMVAVLTYHTKPSTAQHGPIANPQAIAEHSSDSGLLVGQSETDNKIKTPQYDFYKVLSEKEVRIPDTELQAEVKAEQQKQQASRQAHALPGSMPAAISQTVTAAPTSTLPSPTAKTGGYLLQVGAFPNASDAESLKARLALQGFVAHVQNVSLNGQIFHRVRLGPFNTATQLENARQQLTAAGIHTIALKEND